MGIRIIQDTRDETKVLKNEKKGYKIKIIIKGKFSAMFLYV